MTCRPGQATQTQLRRRGVGALELVFTLPILGLLLLGMFQFSLLFLGRSELVEASRVGARTASLAGAAPEFIEAEVRKVLSPRLQEGLEIELSGGHRSGDTVCVGVKVPMNAVSPDLLWPIGYQLAGRHLYSETYMVKE